MLRNNKQIQTYKQILRTYMLRMLALSQQSPKFALMHPLEQLDQHFNKFLHGDQIKQSYLYQLTNVEIKSDQHCLLVMTLLYDLSKWVLDTVSSVLTQVTNNINKYAKNGCNPIKNGSSSYKYSQIFKQLPQCLIQPTTVQCLISQSLNILKTQKKHQTLISKNNELIRMLLQMIPAYLVVIVYKSKSRDNNKLANVGQDPKTNVNANLKKSSSLQSNFMGYYEKLYEMLKQTRQSYTVSSKQEIKRNFNRGVQDSIRAISNIFTFANNTSSLINTSGPSPLSPQNQQQHINNLCQILWNCLKYIQLVHKKSCEDLYKVVSVVNAITMANYTNSTLPVNPNNINANINIPTQQILGIYSEVVSLYAHNYSQVIISRLKIIRIIIELLANVSEMEITSLLLNLKSKLKQQDCKDSTIPAQFTNLPGNLYYNQLILHKSSHVLIQINSCVKNSNYYIVSIIYGIYQSIIRLLLKKQSMVPLYLYTHIVINNLKLLMEWNYFKYSIVKGVEDGDNSVSNTYMLIIPQLHIHTTSYTTSIAQSASSSSQIKYNYNQLVLLETILTQICNLFEYGQLEYFLKLYDWNFMEEDICLNSIKYLYQFIENSDNQTRQEYQLFKKCLVVINKKIQQFLDKNKYTQQQHRQKQKGTDDKKIEQQQKPIGMNLYQSPKRQRKQFYELKRKQYVNLVQKMNKKPKQIFRTIEQFNKNRELQVKEDYIQKVVRILKKSNNIEHRAMIDIVASNTPQAQQILDRYIQVLLYHGNTSKFNISEKDAKNSNCNLEHYLRSIISNFFLSGQSQQIIRFLDKTTQYFHRHQSPDHNIFKNSDSVYTYANAIILLNSDQHNPKNPNKMAVQSFMKICQNINNGQNLPVQIVKQTYKNIKQSEIHTFRNRYKMQKISLQCWLDLVNDYESVGLAYYDEQMADICKQNEGISYQNDSKGTTNQNAGFKQFANQLLLSVIDEKETQKLELMVERFEYDDRKFDCQIIQKIRTMIISKKHIAMHILQKIFEQADFANKKLDDKMLSYCWLGTGIIDNFYETLSYSKIAEYILKTWRVSFEMKDNLHFRQNLQFKSIKKYIRQIKKRQSKKSIINMFSKFFSAKDSQNSSDQNQGESPTLSTSRSGSSLNSGSNSNNRKKANITNSAFSICKLLMNTKQSRTRSAETILLSLRKQQSKRFEQFMSCLFLIFHFVYGDETIPQNSKRTKSYKLSPNQYENGDQYENNRINGQCIDILINLLNDFYCITEPHKIGSRILSLKTKNIQMYQLIFLYSQYWTLKILFTWSIQNYKNFVTVDNSKNTNQYGQQEKAQQNAKNKFKAFPTPEMQEKIKQIYNKCASFISKINIDLLNQFVKILDINVKGLNVEVLVEDLGINKQIVMELKSAVQTHGIKLQFLQLGTKDKDKQKQKQKDGQKAKIIQQKKKQQPGVIKRSRSQPQKQHIKQDAQTQKLLKQINIETSKPIHLQNKQLGVEKQMQKQPIESRQKEIITINENNSQKENTKNNLQQTVPTKDELKQSQNIQQNKIEQIEQIVQIEQIKQQVSLQKDGKTVGINQEQKKQVNNSNVSQQKNDLQDIQQRLMQQLGLKNIPEEPVPNEEGTKMEETPNANMNKQAQQNNRQIQNSDQKKQVNSNASSNQELGLPIYML